MTLLLIFLLGAMLISFMCSVLESSLMSTPLSYINIGRMLKEDDEIAKVNIIVPHSQGTTAALTSVIPCYYELTYERGI